MKKLFSFLFIVVLCFTLAACNASNNGKEKEESITINYETNGGSAVASSKINVKDASTFTLPQNPTKEGFVFAGWFTDADLKTPFDALAAGKDSITLYAKWDEEGQGLRGNLSLSFAVKVDVAPFTTTTETSDTSEEHVDISGTALIDVALENDEVEELKDLKASICFP